MNASLAQHVVPVTASLAVAEAHGVLKLTLFPRRLAPPALWIAAGSWLVILSAVVLVPSLRRFEMLPFVLATLVANLYSAILPYRLRFQLSADGLLYDGEPKAKRHTFELALEEVAEIRSARWADEVVLLVLEASGHAQVIRCFGMKRPDADAVAFALQRRLEELRETRATFRA